jgi:preprotein translocase subunit YajC
MTLPNQLVYRSEFFHLQDPGGGDPTMRSGQEGQTPTTDQGTGEPGQGTGGTGQACGIETMLPFILIFAVIYFLMIRPQKKQEKVRKAMLSEIHKGDKVVTNGGIHGTISNITEDTVTLRVDNIKMTLDRSAIGRVVNRDKGEKPSP